MLISTPPLSSHQLANNLPSSSSSHSSLPSSFSLPITNSNSTSPATNSWDWTVDQVEEWLITHNLNDCIHLICREHRMNGMRLMNLKEDDVLQWKGTTKNRELWTEIKRLQQLYSSNYHMWTNRSSKPMTASSYVLPSSPLPRPIPLRPLRPGEPIRPPCHSTITFHESINQNQPQQVFLAPVQHQQQQQQQQQQQSQQQQQQQQEPSTTIIVEHPSSFTVTRSNSSNNLNDQYHRPPSRSLSTSNTSIEGLPLASSQTGSQRGANQSLTGRRTPEKPIEDQPTVGCCCVGSIRSDRKKTLTAFLLALGTIYFCSFSITVVDERLPDPRLYPPLPDLILENIPHWPWGFAVTEKLILIEMLTLVTVIIFHRHRLIILRRLFAIAAALYFLRSLTMVFTSLPVATPITDCRPERLAHFGARLKKATFIFLAQGMSSFGVKTCGDYLYSGHTCTLVLAAHFINEYSPRSYRLLHILSWLMALTGMFFILAGRQHYSIDILIAWVLASRLFIYYHTLANIQTFSPQDLKRMRIWFPFFTYFEENVNKKIPNEYCLPKFLSEAIATLNTCLSPARYPPD